MSRPLLNLEGRNFGRLHALSESDPYQSPGGQVHRQWACTCECGTHINVRQSALIYGKTVSCGCWSRERGVTHGMSKTPVYSTWKSMMSRCYKERDIGWENYGGRGVRVCDVWHEFDRFVADMGQPGTGDSIDRVDVDGDYEIGNCRWADWETQANNRRTNVRVSFGDKEMTIAQWARKIGASPEALKKRFDAGWTVEAALTTPVGAITELMLTSVKRLHRSGDSASGAKMTFNSAEDMRKHKLKSPGISLTELGKKFGVGRETARKVIGRLSW